MTPLIIDGHLDLAMNAIEWNRDLTQPLDSIRLREQGWSDKTDRGLGVISLPEMRQGRIGICLATMIARYAYDGHPQPGWHSPEIAWAITQAQRAWYDALEKQQQVRILKTQRDVAMHAAAWLQNPDDQPGDLPIGLILTLEGADSLFNFECLEHAFEYGLRAIGPAHYGPGVYAPGTGCEGGLTARGRELLIEMENLKMALDVTHLTDQGFWESLDLFSGPVWASHSNCRWLVPDQRQLNQDQIRALAERDAVIGTALDAWMLVPNWQRGTTQPQDVGVSLQHVADQIDGICQLLGNVRHVAIGSDLDGGFGKEQAPVDLESIADLQKLEAIFCERGYSKSDREAIFCQNWLRHFGESLPP